MGVNLRRRVLVACCFSTASIVPTLVKAEPTLLESSLETPREHARELMREGNARYRADDVQGAHDFYERAFRIAQSFDVACNLGRTEMDLSRYRDAAEHLDYCVRFHILSSKPEAMLNEREAREQLKEAKQHVGWVWLSVDRDGSELWLDSIGVGRAPRSTPIFVEPGPHLAVATRPGFSDASSRFDAKPGVEQIITLRPLPVERVTTPPAAGPAIPSADPPPPEKESAPRKPRLLPWITGGLAIVGAGVGTGFLIAASAKSSDKQNILNGLPESRPCGENTPYTSACGRVRELASDARTETAIGLTSLGLGVVAGVTTAVLLMQPEHEVEATARSTMRVVPTVSSGRFGVSVDAVF